MRPDEQAGEARFAMLETIREFAWEALQATTECSSIQDAHLDAFVELAERVSPQLTTAGQLRALAELDAERDNLRAALGFAVASGKAVQAHRINATMWRYWHMRGLIAEGRDRVNAALALDPGDPALRARTFEAAGGLAYWANDMPGALVLYRDALREAEAADDPRLRGFAHYNLAFPSMMSKPPNMNVAAGIEQLDAAESLFAATGDQMGLASVAWGRSMVAMGQRDLPAVVELGLKAKAMFTAAGDTFMAAWSNHNAGLGYIRLGDLEHAIPIAADSLDEFETAGDISGIILTLGNLVFVALNLLEDERALRLWGAINAIAARSGMNLLEVQGEFVGLTVAEAVARLDPADVERWQAAGRPLDTEEAIALGREIIAIARGRHADD